MGVGRSRPILKRFMTRHFRSSLLLSFAALVPAAAAPERRGLARVARPGPDRRLDRDRPAVALVARRREPRLEGALRRPIVAGRVRRSPLPAEHVRRGRDDAGAADGVQRRHRQAALGAQVQPLHQRRAAAPHRLGLARRRSRHRQRLRLQRQRPADDAVAATASCSGNGRSPRSSACGRRTAAACPRR